MRYEIARESDCPAGSVDAATAVGDATTAEGTCSDEERLPKDRHGVHIYTSRLGYWIEIAPSN